MNPGLISHILLVAVREIRQIASTRSFWITLAIIPAVMIAMPLLARLADNDTVERVMLIDPAGHEAPALREQIELTHQQQILISIAGYAKRHDLQQVGSSDVWARSARWYSDGEVQAFVRAGGAEAALAAMAPKLKPGTPDFDAPEPKFDIVPTPAEIVTAPPEQIAALVQERIDPPPGSSAEKLSYALYIPSTFGPDNATVRLWTSGPPDRELIQIVQAVLTRDLQQKFLEAAGMEPDVAHTAGNLTPAIAIDAPPPGGGLREGIAIRSALPLASAIALLVSMTLSGGWMLQGVVEEKSNKLIETVLASISPNALMYGKLVGTVAVGLLMVAVWIVFSIGAAFATQDAIADLLRPALAPLTSPVVIAAMIYFFVAGYLMVSMIFLAIGAVSESFQDSQNYLMPVVLVLVLPFSLIARSAVSETATVATQVLTWLPLWTPFAMLARLGTGVPLWELLGAGAVLAGFIVLEFFLLGRIFRASLLSAGQKPTFVRLVQLIRTKGAW